MKVFISTQPFAVVSEEPIKLANQHGIEVRLNPLGRKITPEELIEYIGDSDVLIAGTEKIREEVFKRDPNLKLIVRLGVGVDNVDFNLCKKYGVRLANTPDAPAIAVAELSVGLILDLLRKITTTNNRLKYESVWKRGMGNLLYGKTIGIVGLGRIGKALVHMLSGFNVTFLAADPQEDPLFAKLYSIKYVDRDFLFRSSDIISIHSPLNEDTRYMVTMKELKTMKSNCILVNTARGGIVKEEDLYWALKNGVIAGAALDSFEREPYDGPLKDLDNCILTCHIGSSTVESRCEMELQAIEEVIRFKKGLPLKNEVCF